MALKRLDEEIAELIDDEAVVLREITEADEFSERIYESLARINMCVSGAGGSSEGAGPSSSTLSKAKLPKLDLPAFKGDITEWTTFWDMYESAVHSNSNLSSVQKFTYLRTLLSHSGKDAIAGLILSDANYDEAIKVLKERFGNKEKIIANHMEELVNLDSFVCSSGNLRVLYDKIECHTRELRALGMPEQAYNCLLPLLLMKKLPRELALTISRKIPENEWNLTKIMEELGIELESVLTIRVATMISPSIKSIIEGGTVEILVRDGHMYLLQLQLCSIQQVVVVIVRGHTQLRYALRCH